MNMNYAVIGLGAVGSIIGGSLSRINEDVIFVGKKHQVDMIKTRGLRINRGSFQHDLRMTDDFSLLTDRDIVFLCVKSQDTKRTMEQIKRFLKKPVIIISLQNGVHNAEFAEDVCGFKIFSSVILFNSVYHEDGFVSLTMKARILLENAKGYEMDLLQISRVLKKAGIDVKLIDDIQAACWSKLVLNLQIAITALTGQTIDESLTNKTSRKIIIATLKEGVRIVKQSNVRLSRLPLVDPRLMIWMLQIFGSFSSLSSRWLLKLDKNARNSLWQSLVRGKKTEIDYINGEIVRLARQRNLQAPINSKLVELVKEKEGKNPLKYVEPRELQKLLQIE